MTSRALLVLVLLALSSFALSQDCPLPPSLQPLAAGHNLFTDQQESDLGDAIAEGMAREIRVIYDEELTSPLRKLGERLVQYLPPNHFRFHFVLVESQYVDAYSLPGGRVYVTRKLVASVRSEDELAGILAHELGHIVTHQGATYISTSFREVLGVNQVGDRADIFDKYHRLYETSRLHPSKLRVNEQEDQFVADSVAIYAIGRAGFSPSALADWWDRLTETRGKTGNWFSDTFGGTRPEQRRLREMLKSMAALPKICIDQVAGSRSAEFKTWQSDVVAFHSTIRAEALPGVIFKQTLALPLRPDITALRFSPNGQYILAQDGGGIHVLSRSPLQLLFFIDAPDAEEASFSPDSKSVVFYFGSLRVETWDIATQKRTAAHEIILRGSCLQDALSLDGTILACLHNNALLLLDVNTGEPIFTRKSFYEPTGFDAFRIYLSEVAGAKFSPINVAFSPDGHYLLAGSKTASFAFDLTQRRKVSFPGAVRDAVRERFAFAGPDRIVSVNGFSPSKSPVIRFPTGERIADMPLASTNRLYPAAHGDYVLVGPIKDHPLGVLDLNKRQIIVSLKHAAGDMYDGALLAENLAGQVTLTDIATEKTVGATTLVQSRLGAAKAIAVSTDLQWLAVSTRTRGALWDLSHNIRVSQVRGFGGAWFADDHSLYADFPPLGDTKRSIARLDSFGGANSIYDVGENPAKQVGPFLLVSVPATEKSFDRNWSLEVRDIRTKTTIWSRHFPKEPPAWNLNPDNQTLLLGWPLWMDGGRDELAQHPDLRQRADKEDFLLQLVDFQKGTTLGNLVLKTNKSSFRVNDSVADGDWVAVAVSEDRVQIYSLKSGEETGHLFGVSPILSAAAGRCAVSTAVGEVNVYDLASSQLYRQFRFPTSILMKQFSLDGKRLFVLTRDQTAYVLDLTSK